MPATIVIHRKNRDAGLRGIRVTTASNMKTEYKIAKHCQANHGGPSTARVTRENGVRAFRIGTNSHIRLQMMTRAMTMRRRRGWKCVSVRQAAMLNGANTATTTAKMMTARSTGEHNTAVRDGPSRRPTANDR